MAPVSLIDKLGIKAGMKISFLDIPAGFLQILDLPRGIQAEDIGAGGSKDYIHAFYRNREDLRRDIFYLKNRLRKTGMIWISWPKGSSGEPGDLNREIVREEVLREGLVDVKVCSVDQTWSALKFVYRLKDRS